MSAPRLPSDRKAAILEAYLAGVPIATIAARFGVHQSYPGHIARRKGYASRYPNRAKAS